MVATTQISGTVADASGKLACTGRSVHLEMSPAFFFWVVLAVLFVAAELHSIAFFAVFGAAGSVAAAIVALFAEDAYALQIAVAIAVAVLGIVLVRPYVSKAFESHGPNDRIGGVHGGLISARGITIDVVGSDTPRRAMCASSGRPGSP